uniref:GTP-binding protein n=1 Tax=Anopheles atroparvus TaxID=41427 RepID=A0A182J4M6_ANOAO
MKKKVLLMGKSGSGKTSMRSIIFANYIARDTRRLGATIDVEHSHVRFLGNLVLNLWDCGGQESFMEQYFASQKDNIFRNVEVLIYVFDVESRELEKDMHYYQSCLEALLMNSPNAKIFCLVHKMDLVAEEQRDIIFKEREEDLKRCSRPLECTAFRTSIWDETLYRAWSSIVYQLIPNVKALEHSLNYFANVVDADEVLLFERATFLVISHCQRKQHRDSHRFEKVSNIIKQFKLSCSKLGAKFSSMEVRNSVFAAFIDTFTSNTYVMVVMSDPSIPSEATLINIRNARKYFEELENPNSNLNSSSAGSQHASSHHLHHSVAANHGGHGLVNGGTHPNLYAGSGGGYHQYSAGQQQPQQQQQQPHHLTQYQAYQHNTTTNAYH